MEDASKNLVKSPALKQAVSDPHTLCTGMHPAEPTIGISHNSCVWHLDTELPTPMAISWSFQRSSRNQSTVLVITSHHKITTDVLMTNLSIDINDDAVIIYLKAFRMNVD